MIRALAASVLVMCVLGGSVVLAEPAPAAASQPAAVHKTGRHKAHAHHKKTARKAHTGRHHKHAK